MRDFQFRHHKVQLPLVVEHQYKGTLVDEIRKVRQPEDVVRIHKHKVREPLGLHAGLNLFDPTGQFCLSWGGAARLFGHGILLNGCVFIDFKINKIKL